MRIRLTVTFHSLSKICSLKFSSVQFPSVRAEIPGLSRTFPEIPGTSGKFPEL